MGGRKHRRNTAKSGDKAIYKNKSGDHLINRKEEDNDPIYDAVDRFHSDDYLRLDQPVEDDESEEDWGEEAVMDLGVSDEEEESDDEVDSSDDEEEDEEVPISDDDELKEESEDENVRDWGSRKSAYYHGDTADLEIGQDEEDAVLEEAAAKEVLAARFMDMTEEDFAVSSDDDDTAEIKDMPTSMSQRNLLQLSIKDKRRLLNKHHPEFLPLVTHFSKIIREYDSQTSKAVNAMFFGEEGTADSVGATKLGQQYLLTKAMIQASTSLNLLMYLLLKSEQRTPNPGNTVDPALIQSHPVLLHLQKLQSWTKKLEEGVEHKVTTLSDELETIVKASELLSNPENALSEDESMPEESDDGDVEDDEQTDNEDEAKPSKSIAGIRADESPNGESSTSDDDSSVDEETTRRTALTEARFGLRPMEMHSLDSEKSRRTFLSSDAGDVELDDATQLKRAGQSLATTLNSIEQRTATQRQRQKRPTQQLVEHLDEPNDDELRRGLDMMEADLGKASDDEQEMIDENVFDPELDDEYDNTDDFYGKVSKKSKAAKEEKKRHYAVAPKFPRVEEEIVGERAVGTQIMKNRGLVAHKAKINRNPRVKKREQYRKALRNRKGAVRDVRTGEGHHYGGEQTGIKTSVTRSRKLV